MSDAVLLYMIVMCKIANPVNIGIEVLNLECLT